MSRASLVEAYISALPFAAVAIVSDGLRCRIEIGGTSAPAFYFKPSHLELVLASIDQESLAGKPPAAVASAIEQAAAKMLEAPFQTPGELRKAAGQQVDKITARIKVEGGPSGALKKFNTGYRAYRLAQIEKHEPAISYAVFLEEFVVTPAVRHVAAKGRMI